MCLVFPRLQKCKYSCFWTLDLLSRLHAHLNKATEIDQCTYFLCDLFVYSVCLFAGTLTITTDRKPLNGIYSRQTVLNAFPHSIRFLYERKTWMESQMRVWTLINSHQPNYKCIFLQINEFLFQIATKVPPEFARAFKRSLITNKNLKHFDAIWTKYVEMRIYEN